MEGIRVETHDRVKYYGYFGVPGKELTMWDESSEEDTEDERPADQLVLLMERLKQRMWEKALTQARKETGKDEC